MNVDVMLYNVEYRFIVTHMSAQGLSTTVQCSRTFCVSSQCK